MLNFATFEEIKQWTNVPGLSQTPSLTDSPQGGTGVSAPVEGISIQGVGHVLPLSGMAVYAIQFLGLSTASNPTPTPTPSSGGSTCSMHYAISRQWPGGFGASVILTHTGLSTINGWTLQWTLPDGETITRIWNASQTQSGSTVPATNLSYNGTIAPGGSTNSGFNGSWSGRDSSPSAFPINRGSCTVV